MLLLQYNITSLLLIIINLLSHLLLLLLPPIPHQPHNLPHSTQSTLLKRIIQRLSKQKHPKHHQHNQHSYQPFLCLINTAHPNILITINQCQNTILTILVVYLFIYKNKNITYYIVSPGFNIIYRNFFYF